MFQWERELDHVKSACVMSNRMTVTYNSKQSTTTINSHAIHHVTPMSLPDVLSWMYNGRCVMNRVWEMFAHTFNIMLCTSTASWWIVNDFAQLLMFHKHVPFISAWRGIDMTARTIDNDLRCCDQSLGWTNTCTSTSPWPLVLTQSSKSCSCA